jgi:hypothetical protein
MHNHERIAKMPEKIEIIVVVDGIPQKSIPMPDLTQDPIFKDDLFTYYGGSVQQQEDGHYIYSSSIRISRLKTREEKGKDKTK